MISALLAIQVFVGAFEYREEPGALFPSGSAISNTSDLSYAMSKNRSDISADWMVFSSYSRPYDNAGLNAGSTGFIAAGDSLYAGGTYSRFGLNFYREEKYSVLAGIKNPHNISFFIRPHCNRLVIDTEVVSLDKRFLGVDSGIFLSPFRQIKIAFTQENIQSLVQKEKRDILFPASIFSASVSPLPGFSCIWEYHRTATGGINSWIAEADLMKGFALTGGYSRETYTYACGAAFSFAHCVLNYTMRYHAYLGTTHALALSYQSNERSGSVLPLRIPQIKSGGESSVRIDLTQCTADDLLTLSGIDSEHAERIIKYRELIGPINEKALVQLDVSREGIDSIRMNSLDLPDETEEPAPVKKMSSAERRSYTKQKEETRSLFLRLVSAGLTPVKALKISSAVNGKKNNEIAPTIREIAGLSDAEKNLAVSVCSKR